jgi:V/A-type H+-transporting ATPase subunit A
MAKSTGRIIKVAGPLVVAEGMYDAKVYDVVKVSDKNLVGEIIEIRGDKASIQVYEETAGIGVGEPVVSTGMPLSVELGPGIIETIYDGIQRPLDAIVKKEGSFISRGVEVFSLDREKKWEFKPCKKKGDKVAQGDVIGTVDETSLVVHKIMVPPKKSGEIIDIKSGSFTVDQDICTIKTDTGEEIKLQMMHKWPVRISRPITRKLLPVIPLSTGQRVVDALFPIAMGGTAAVPGPFGSGKTVIQHQLAKWASAQIVVYVGCGERGNEMTDVLTEFPELEDPKTGEPLMKRTVLIANTSNMPVAAREASVYTGMALAEYFRDMGYDVALMADSTSRWAEAMREMSGRLEEMPGEEGYPAYLGTRIAEFYERAGRAICLGKDENGAEMKGSVTAIGAVSPPGGDLSDPVVQATLRVVKVFWSLDAKLAYKRHFPAINWLSSYSFYHDNLKEYLLENVSEEWVELKNWSSEILQKESELDEIVRLIGLDALSPENRLIMETSKSLREDFLHQNAFHEIDSYSSLKKDDLILKLIKLFHEEAGNALARGVEIGNIIVLGVRERIARARYVSEDKVFDESESIKKEIVEKMEELV